MNRHYHARQSTLHTKSTLPYLALVICAFCLNACDDAQSVLSPQLAQGTTSINKDLKTEFEKQIASKLEIMLPLLENGTPIPPSVAKCIAKDRASKFSDIEIAFIMDSHFGEQEAFTRLDSDSLNTLHSKLNSLENLISFPPHCYENLVK
ncbi:hypothetical protein [Helicobacter sp. T3_23-1056]